MEHVSNPANITATFTFSLTTFTHRCTQAEVRLYEWYPMEKIALRDDSFNAAHKKHLSPSRTLFKKPIVIQLVQVQLRAFQLQIRA